MKYALPLALALLVAVPAHAQETTAGGTLGTEASWTALQSMIQSTNNNLKIMRTDVTAIQTCAAKGMFHAPSLKDADPKTGCYTPPTTSLSHFDIINTPNKINCYQRVALANKYVGHKNATDYLGVPYSGTLIGTDGNWIIQSGDGDCSPMSNDARWPIMIPMDTNNKPIKNFFRIVK